MAYTKTTDFGAKDTLPSGDPDKVIYGSEFDTEFDAIESASSAVESDVTGLDARVESIEDLSLSVKGYAVLANENDLGYLRGTEVDLGVGTGIYDVSWPTGDAVFATSDSTGSDIFEYSLATSGDISSVNTTPNNTLSLSYAPVGIDVSPDRVHMIVADTSNKYIRYYTMSTAGDLSTATLQASIDISSGTGAQTVAAVRGVCFSDDGSYVVATGLVGTDNWAYVVSLSTDYDGTTASTPPSGALMSESGLITGLSVGPDIVYRAVDGPGSNAYIKPAYQNSSSLSSTGSTGAPRETHTGYADTGVALNNGGTKILSARDNRYLVVADISRVVGV